MIRRIFAVVGHVTAYAFIVYLAVLIVLRPWHRDWGANAEERERRLPGDEHAAAPERAGDRAIAIDAPAEDVWSWLVQIGQDRGGFYSYASLENAAGVRVTNAEHVMPAWQSLRRGDFVRATPPDWLGGVFGERIGWEVDHVDDGRLLALRYWIFEVVPTSATTSRLHIRTHAGNAPVPVAPLLFAVFEPAHFIMERGMLRGIKERAEHGGRPALARVDRATVRSGEEIVVLLSRQPTGVAAVDQTWVTLAPAGTPPDEAHGRVVLDRSAREVRFRAPSPGDYEVRIHGRYPAEPHHLVERIPVRVDGYVVRTGIEPMPPPRLAD